MAMPRATRADTLILGAGGYLGRHLARRLGPEKSVGTYRSSPFAGGIRFDALADDVGGLLDGYGPFRVAYILLAESRIDRCAEEPARAYAINVAGVKRIVDALQARNVLPVFASTDAVFDGGRGNYAEEDAADPILTYGRQKLEVERYLAASSGPYIVARFSKMVDPDPAGAGTLGDWIRAFRDGSESLCASDQRFSAIDVRDAVHALVALSAGAPPGLYHVGGPRSWDRASLFDALVQAIRRHVSILPAMRRCSINDFPQFLERRPLDISMCSRRLAQTVGVTPRDLTETCAEIARAAYG